MYAFKGNTSIRDGPWKSSLSSLLKIFLFLAFSSCSNLRGRVRAIESQLSDTSERNHSFPFPYVVIMLFQA